MRSVCGDSTVQLQEIIDGSINLSSNAIGWTISGADTGAYAVECVVTIDPNVTDDINLVRFTRIAS